MSSVTYMGHFPFAKSKEIKQLLLPVDFTLKKNLLLDLFISVLKILTLFYVILDQSICPVSLVLDILI